MLRFFKKFLCEIVNRERPVCRANPRRCAISNIWARIQFDPELFCSQHRIQWQHPRQNRFMDKIFLQFRCILLKVSPLIHRNSDSEPLTRVDPPLGDVTVKREAFTVTNRTYKQQFASIYFLRLAVLKDYCVNACAEKWNDMAIAGQKAKHVERVLDVRQGELGWVVGTVYMDLPLKPNVLEDLARDVSLHFRSMLTSSILLQRRLLEKSTSTRMATCRSCLRTKVDE